MCQACATGCVGCTGAGYGKCTTCTSVGTTKLWLTAGGAPNVCDVACPAGQYMGDVATHDHLCQTCDVSCKICNDGTVNCVICPSFNLYHLGSSGVWVCVAACPLGYYKDIITDATTPTCKKCPLGCSNCTDGAIDSSGFGIHCTACQSVAAIQYFLVNTTVETPSKVCSTSCPTGQVMGTGTNAGLCVNCNAECATCWGNASTCTSCAATFKKFKLITGGISCNTTCPDGTWVSGNDCLPCSIGCQKCTTSATTCTACANTTLAIYRQLTSVSTSCVTDSCPLGWFASANICVQCAKGCTKCNGPAISNCQLCGTVDTVQFYLVGGTTCATSCPVGQFISGSTCMLCDVSCKECIDATTTCSFCSSDTVTGAPLYLATTGCVADCPAGFYKWLSNDPTITNRCNRCNPACKVCTTSGTASCSACANDGVTDYFLALTTTICASTCPAGQYKGLASAHLCVACDPSCQTCTTTATTCIICATGRLMLADFTCVAACSVSGTGSNGTHCVPCNVACLTCSGPSIAQGTSCTTNGTVDFYLSMTGAGCLENCPAGQFGQVSDHTCQPCDMTACLECTTIATTCTKCRNGTYLSAGACVVSCPATLVYVDNVLHKCVACHSTCLTCYGSAFNNCLTCGGSFPKLWVSTCLAACPANTFDSSGCVACSALCATCAGAGACTTCIAGYYKNSATSDCETTCLTTEYPDIATGTCTACTTGCGRCVATGTDSCSTCTGSFFLAVGTTTCATTCPAGQFAPITGNVCSLCSTTCATCSAVNTCLTCKFIGTATAYLSGTTCVTSCPTATFADPVNNVCTACTPGCTACFGSGLTFCTACGPIGATPYYLTGTTCGTTCASGTYISGTTCLPCDISCSSCTGSATVCGAGNCNTGYEVAAGSACTTTCTCGPKCVAGKYHDGAACVACDPACATCTGPLKTACYTCKNNGTINYFKVTGATTCDTVCSGTEYKNLATFTCVACDIKCTACTSATVCTGCATVATIPYYLLNGTCVSVCPVGYYTVATGQTCQPCPTGCKTCTGPLNNTCTSCQTGYYLGADDGICYTACPDGQYLSNGACLYCDITCTKCSGGSATSCTFCGGIISTFLNGGACIISCPSATYGVVSTDPTLTSKCLPCATGCTQCTGSAASNCQTCAATYYLDAAGTTCWPTGCPYGQYESATPKKCAACDPSCAKCTAATASSCTACNTAAGMYLVTNTCVSSCGSA